MTDEKVISVIDGVTRLSDGSGFFTATIGERPLRQISGLQ